MGLVLDERGLDFSLKLLGDGVFVFFELLLYSIQFFLFRLEKVCQSLNFLAHQLEFILNLCLLSLVFKVELRDVCLELLNPSS